MIKDILVNLSVGKPRDVAGDFAISVANAFQAHLSAIAFAYDPALGGTIMDGASAPFIDEWRAEQRAKAEKSQQAFELRARLAGVTAMSKVHSDDAADAALVFGELARHYDLSVVGQEEQDDDVPQSLMIEAALFGSGRPVLVVPYIQTADIKFDRIMLCWDGSRNAARAVADALPILQRAAQIDVVTIQTKERRNSLLGALIAEHLARHKLKVNLKPIVAPDSDVANVVLSQAADSETDLIVMGGYGHSRLREFILGGATRGILESMTVPVLMSH
jgi:nucleotide-binding universal stress UspA family protein